MLIQDGMRTADEHWELGNAFMALEKTLATARGALLLFAEGTFLLFILCPKQVSMLPRKPGLVTFFNRIVCLFLVPELEVTNIHNEFCFI